MTSRPTVTVEVEEWQAVSMRITAFLRAVVPATPTEWWNSAVGSEPEAIASRPKAGEYQVQGAVEGKQLTLHVLPGRIDWKLSALAKGAGEELTDFLISMGLLSESLASIRKLASTWLPGAPELVRLAFGAVLAQPTQSPHDAFVRLRRYLPAVTIDPDGTSDFLYQINRPRPSTSIQGRYINRLTKWSVLAAQRIIMPLGGEAIRSVDEGTSCRLELDINTTPIVGDILPTSGLTQLFTEMTDLASELAQRGDVP